MSFGIHQPRTACHTSAAGAALILALFASGCSSSSSAPSNPPVDTSSALPSSSSPATDSHVDGKITALEGATWTVEGKDGKYTVTVAPTTRFGDEKHPQSREQFKVGDMVDINGTVKGTTITASSLEKF